jgi:phosphoglycolate phosphatase-like HAD superfamily hydrolase
MTAPASDASLWLLDFDNTLAALEREVDWPGSRRELEAWLRAAGVDDRIFAEIPKGNLPIYAALHSRWIRTASGAAHGVAPPPADPESLLRHASEIIERHELVGAERAAPTPGAIELLEAIAARGAVAIIVTSNSSRTVQHWLDRHGVGALVRAIVGRDSLLALKPSPEMVARALAISSSLACAARSAPPDVEAFTPMSAADAVFVGDSLADFEAARAAGVGFYGVATAESACDRLVAAGATDIYTSPGALRIHLNLAPTSER